MDDRDYILRWYSGPLGPCARIQLYSSGWHRLVAILWELHVECTPAAPKLDGETVAKQIKQWRTN